MVNEMSFIFGFLHFACFSEKKTTNTKYENMKRAETVQRKYVCVIGEREQKRPGFDVAKLLKYCTEVFHKEPWESQG